MPANHLFEDSPDFGTLYIFGAGGSGREVAWLAEQMWQDQVERIFLVDEQFLPAGPVDGLEVRVLTELKPDDRARFVVALGDCAQRRSASERCAVAGLRAATLVHPRSELSSRVTLGKGSIVCAGAIVTTRVVLGSHVHVNIACTISHDVQVGDFTTFSPGVHVAGHVHIGSGVFFGTGANVINGSSDKPLVIGDGAMIAAGACVTKSVEPGTMVAGVPATRQR